MDTQSIISTDTIISLMESGLDLTFSKEQQRILSNSHETPLLINACAGSGKTTIFILMILVALTRNLVEPQEVLGITFSRKSKLDMDHRYNEYVDELFNVGLNYENLRPDFFTFHSLFLRLLMTNEEYREIHVLDGYSCFEKQLSERITHPSKVMSKSEILNQIFSLNNYLINQNLTIDGLNLNGSEKMTDQQVVDILSQYTREVHDWGFYQDYFEVINYYQELKAQNGLIDFNDMKLLLLRSMKQERNLKKYRDIMSRYKLVVIDEFQDIDSLQWEIISKLLSKETLDRLIVIGDDDQSIYSFRGSDPKYIMNYRNLMSNTKTLNLSTNYRTGGNILRCVIPSITKNSIRLNKSLGAVDSQTGKIFFYKPQENTVKTESILEHLVGQIENSNIDNNDIAVLVRYNSARSIAADWLANRKIYSNLGNNKLVLQQNTYYKVIVELMRALWDDKFKYFYGQSRRIGFRNYTDHIDEIKLRYGKVRIVKLSKYLDLVKDTMSSLTKTELDDYGESFDVQVIKEFNMIQALKKNGGSKNNSDITLKLFNSAKELSSKYFDFMCSNKYISIKELTKLFTYLEDEVSEISSPNTFFTQEDKKEAILTKKGEFVSQKFQVQFLSLHQAKGLEFKYVYLYGLTDKELHRGSLQINEYFHPNISFNDFVGIFSNQLFSYKKKMDGYFENALIGEYSDLLDDENFDVNDIKRSMTAKDNMGLVIALYNATKEYSAFIEEERRLLYVGVTRAKLELNVDISADCNPLLFELNEPS
ncbi:ATP-dependent DNA helicase UvrD [Companilactobacillus mindensis DSM 14500]|uniref:DNA 3'-5' helicase n=2 Tax=Companilactobacillus mindensis TaxID=167481 RepID=A0A0R1QJ35_9LACO|nr:ATP-dependent helicase [Companilactobacillus mindensis]KRL44797.1 ATP-dependent DNA helicase UvrD [Companilactobacillus mindensis DSM 14500]GEO78024.1 DNA helicase [Companilactobacillus mindensis]